MIIKKPTNYQYIKIDHSRQTPLYRQIIDSVIKEVKRKNISVGDQLPSINVISEEFFIARETVVKAYRELRERGIIFSKQGKGFYLRSLEVEWELNVFLLFNKISPHKKVIYDSIVSELSNYANVDLHIYHNDYESFKNLILNNLDNYTHFIIISHFSENSRSISHLLEKIPADKLIVLDREVIGLQKEHAAVYQNFRKDIYESLCEAMPELQKYGRVNLVYPASSYHPLEIQQGFIEFCKDHHFNFRVLNTFNYEDDKIKEAYIMLEEHDLVELLRTAKKYNMELGKDIGLISYNESPLKEFILNGITVISTDFEKMGKTAARMVLEGKAAKIENPFYLIRRASL